jgi:hypothetical protein
MSGEFYCVCELYYVGAALAFVSVVSYLCQQNQQPVNNMDISDISVNCRVSKTFASMPPKWVEATVIHLTVHKSPSVKEETK